MSFLFPASPLYSPGDRIQARLFKLAAGFVFCLCLALSLAPAVREGSWAVAYPWKQWVGFAVWLALFSLLHRQSRSLLPGHDPYLLPLVSLLAGWGLVTIFRLSPAYGFRQTAWLALCLVMLIVGLRLPGILELLRRYKYLWLTGGLLLTALTFFLGSYPDSNLSGPRLWLGCCGVYIQPSEPLKLLLIVFLAAYLANNLRIRTSLIELITPLLAMAGVAMVLLIAQRDLGTASLFIFIFTMVLYVASERKRILIISAILAVAAGLVGFFFFDVVRLRLDAWLNPWLDPSGRSYQIVQSLLAVANGGILGRGTGLGSPGLVPVAISDFIFAAISEEYGLVGAIGLILVEAILTVRAIRIALQATNAYQRYLAAGLTAFLSSQAVLIIGGNLRLLPLTGVTLPFVSYGGSSLVTVSFALLLLLHISSHPDQEPARLSNPRPYFFLAGVLLAGLAGAAMVAGWWSVIRSDALLTRSDNPRRAIADRFVMRGTLYDRDGETIDITQGITGSLDRKIQYPALSPIVGYTNATFGQAGLEATLDPTLRGLTHYPLPTIWWSEILYGHPPTGLDVRLTLDLDRQRQADELLGDQSGAVVLLNAQTSELLALSSHPYFDANTLEGELEQLSTDPQAPLLDRVSQGAYTPGTALAPFLWALAGTPPAQTTLPDRLDLSLPDGRLLTCARTAQTPVTWSTALAAGCPAALAQLAGQTGSASILAGWDELGFFTTPDVPLPTNPPSARDSVDPASEISLGQNTLTLSPLQVARAAAALSNNGSLPALRLVSEVHDPQQGWQPEISAAQPIPVFSADQVETVLNGLTASGGKTWEYTGLSLADPEHPVTWYLSGGIPGQSEALVVVVVLEKNDPLMAETIGQGLLNTPSP